MIRKIIFFCFMVFIKQSVFGLQVRILEGKHGTIYIYDENGDKLNQGATSVVFPGLQISDQDYKPVSMKFGTSESHEVYTEAKRLEALQKKRKSLKECAIPEFYEMLQPKPSKEVLVFNLLGPTLETLLEKHFMTFSIKTTMMLGLKMLDIIEYLHSNNIIHNNIKPRSFAIGYQKKEKSKIYIADLGMWMYYKIGGIHIREDPTVYSFGKGTQSYASLYAHSHKVLSRRDDLESTGYVMIKFLKGTLPWVKSNGNPIFEDKVNFAKFLTKENWGLTLEKFINYTRGLRFDEDPNYDYLRRLLLEELKSDGTSEPDWEYDWSNKKLPKIKFTVNDWMEANINDLKGMDASIRKAVLTKLNKSNEHRKNPDKGKGESSHSQRSSSKKK